MQKHSTPPGGLEKPLEIRHILIYQSPASDLKVFYDQIDHAYEDTHGHKYTFKREGEQLYLTLQGEKKPYAAAKLREYLSETDLRKIDEKEELKGKQIRAWPYKAKEYLDEDGRPKPEHKGRWVLPAYIAYLKNNGAKAFVVDPVQGLDDYYLSLHFDDVEDADRYLRLELTP